MLSLVLPALVAGLAAPTASHQATPQAEPVDSIVLYSAGLDAHLVSPKDAALARALHAVGPRLVSLFEGHGEEIDGEAVTLLHGLATKPFCLRIGGGPAGPAAQLTVRHDDEADAHWAAEIVARLASEGGVRFEQAPEGDGALVAMSPAGPMRLDAGTGPAGPRLVLSIGTQREETFSFDDTGLPGDAEPTFFFRFDGAPIGEMAMPLLSMMGSEPPIGPMMLLQTFCSPDSPVVSYATSASAARGVSVLRSIGGAAAARRRGTLVEESLDAADFRRIPADATWARMAQWNPSSYLGALDAIQPGAVEAALGQMKAMTGVDLRADLLDHIGPTVSAYTARSTGGGIFSGVLLLESSDADAVAEAMTTLWTTAAPLIAAQTEQRVDVRSWTSGETDCATVVFPGLPIPVEPSFAAAEGVVVCALSRSALTAALEQLGRDRGLIANARLASVPKRAYGGLAGFGFYDAPRFVLDGYGTLSIGAGALANAMHAQGPSDDLFESVLPTPRALAAKVRPTLSFARIKGDDIVETTTRDGSFLVRCGACLGGPLGESQMMSLGLPIVASIAIPKLMSSRLAANENAAIATLRSFAAAQAQFQASGSVDTDGDGAGEFALLGELTGTSPLRKPNGRGGVALGEELLSPPYLAPGLAPEPTLAGVSVTVRSGYVFQMWLPAAGLAGTTDMQLSGNASAPLTSPTYAEDQWCAYAWPLDHGKTGNRAFCITQGGDIVAFDNERAVYHGMPGSGGQSPSFDAALALSSRSDGWHTTAEVVVGSFEGSDGNDWVPIGY
ncbi:MAG: hypothetical protein AAF957_16570 [Planctomycetota bacterium]